MIISRSLEFDQPRLGSHLPKIVSPVSLGNTCNYVLPESEKRAQSLGFPGIRAKIHYWGRQSPGLNFSGPAFGCGALAPLPESFVAVFSVSADFVGKDG